MSFSVVPASEAGTSGSSGAAGSGQVSSSGQDTGVSDPLRYLPPPPAPAFLPGVTVAPSEKRSLDTEESGSGDNAPTENSAPESEQPALEQPAPETESEKFLDRAFTDLAEEESIKSAHQPDLLALFLPVCIPLVAFERAGRHNQRKGSLRVDRFTSPKRERGG
jgi:hypothetical protein